MCGLIAGFHSQPNIGKGKKLDDQGPVSRFIVDQFQDQASRGTEGFGIISIDKNKEIDVKRSTREVKFMIDLMSNDSRAIIAHHRNPTSTENKVAQTHPIKVENEDLMYNYLVVHNGIITNCNDLHWKHTSMGFNYTTETAEQRAKSESSHTGYRTWEYNKRFNDSESLAIELALFIEGKQTHIGTQGGAAFIVLQATKDWKPMRVFFGKTEGAVLNMAKTRGRFYLSSEGPGNVVEPNSLYSFETKDANMELSKKKIVWSPFSLPKTETAPKETTQSSLPVVREAGSGTESNTSGVRTIQIETKRGDSEKGSDPSAAGSGDEKKAPQYLTLKDHPDAIYERVDNVADMIEEADEFVNQFKGEILGKSLKDIELLYDKATEDINDKLNEALTFFDMDLMDHSGITSAGHTGGILTILLMAQERIRAIFEIESSHASAREESESNVGITSPYPYAGA